MSGMVDDLRAHRQRIRTLSDSSRSDGSSRNSESDTSNNNSTVASASPAPQVRSRKQNIRELREEFEDFPELYGIRRSGRSRKEPSRFKPPIAEHVDPRFKRRKRIGSSSSTSDHETDSDDDWSRNVSSKARSVRTRGNRVNYTSAFKDESFDESDDEPSERSNLTAPKSVGHRNAYGTGAFNQQTSLQKPRGPLVRKTCASTLAADRSLQSVKANNNNHIDHTESNSQASENDDDEEELTHEQEWVEDEEADIIEEVLSHAVRRKGATGNPTTMYNTRLEKDLNAGFDPDKEEGELQYLIKWRNWSHIHSTWETEASLRAPERGFPVAGMKKFYAYQTMLREKKERLRYAERDDLETLAYEEERDEQLLQDKMNVERIVSHSRDPETNTFDYLIKWYRLDYRFCSWESGKVIRALYSSAVQDYEERCRSSTLPNRKCEVLHSRPKFQPLLEQPSYLGNSEDLKLRDYQLEGINWIIRAWTRGNSVILADEMGLGKTIQTIGFLSYLFNEHRFYGPFLIVVPLSTISSWQKELQSWAPEMNSIIYTGDHISRQLIREHEWCSGGASGNRRQQSLKFNVCVTTYEILLKDKSWLGQVSWGFLGVDEAHRLKNDSSQLYKALKMFDTNTRLLITGTPLQNTMKELWALLHFIMPDTFHDWDEFESAYSVMADDPANRLNGEAFHNLHKALKPFLLRRVKKDVESSLPEKIEQILRVDMTKEQANIYRLILARNYDGLMKVTRGHKASFINIVMELKKCCNHAHLIAPPSDNDRQIMTKEDMLRSFIRGSGKATLLDKLLMRLKSKGHRVLIFSQMVRMLDLIADYLSLRNWGFQRLDGSIRGELRKQSLDHFNAEGSTDFCFLLSTRAGGLGINLATADTVIIFDSDWNPQNDLQAQARAHRIGQTKQVSVYRLVTRESVEEKIIESATRKMVLDHLVIQRMDSAGRGGPGRRGDTAKGQLLTEILRYGAEGLFKQADEDAAELEVDIDDILNRAETRDTEATAEANPANALLSSFKVVTLDALEEESNDVGLTAGSGKTWDEIIPSDLRGQLKAEEAQKTLVELELGPRRRRQVKTFQAGMDVNLSSSEDSDAEGSEKLPSTQLSEREIRALIRAIRHFARPLERIDAIAADAELPDRSEAELREVIDAVLKGCKAAMQNATTNASEENQKPVSGGKGPVFQYGRVSVAARPLLQSIEYLEILHRCLPEGGKEARMLFELPFNPKPVAWSCPWDTSDDVRLLAGVYEHGYDNWDSIKMDADLGLGSKLLPVSQTDRPQANHIRSRVDYLLKMLAKHSQSRPVTASVIDDQASTAAGRKRRRVDHDPGPKPKQRASTKTNSKSHTAAAISMAKPKSAEFVETDDSSSESDDMDDAINVQEHRKPKVKQEPKTKPEKSSHTTHKSDNQALSMPSPQTNDESPFTKEERREFREMRGTLFLKCKEKLSSIKKHFKQLERLEDADEEDPKLFAKVILRIGDHIHSLVHEVTNKNERQAWRDYLWEFVQMFSKKTTEELKHIYKHAVKRRLKDTQTDDDHSTHVSNKHHNLSPKNKFTDHRYSNRDRSYDTHRDHTNSAHHNKSKLTGSNRRHSHNRSRSRERDNRDHGFGRDKYNRRSGGFSNDWSSPGSGHHDSHHDRNSARFDNAFNRPPSQYSQNQSNSKHSYKDRSFSSQNYSSQISKRTNSVTPYSSSSSSYHHQRHSDSFSSSHPPSAPPPIQPSRPEIPTSSPPKSDVYSHHYSVPPLFPLAQETSGPPPDFNLLSHPPPLVPPPPVPLPPLIANPIDPSSLSRDPRLTTSRR